MKIYHWLLPALSLFPASAAAQMAGYEYWTDGNDTQRTYVEQTQGSVGIEIEVADLRPGIHRFHFRACDAQGRWSSPFCRYFLRLGKAYDGTGMATCEYAIDGGEWAEAALVDAVSIWSFPYQAWCRAYTVLCSALPTKPDVGQG